MFRDNFIAAAMLYLSFESTTLNIKNNRVLYCTVTACMLVISQNMHTDQGLYKDLGTYNGP